MSANSHLNRYKAVPPIPPKPGKKNNMSTSKTVRRESSQPSDLHVSGNAGLVSKVTVKRQASRTTGTGGTKKMDRAADTMAQPEADAQCNGKAEDEVTSTTNADQQGLVRSQEVTAVTMEKEASFTLHEKDAENAAAAKAEKEVTSTKDADQCALVRSQEVTAVTAEKKEALLTVCENDAENAAAANDEDGDEDVHKDDDDDAQSSTSVSLIFVIYCIKLHLQLHLIWSRWSLIAVILQVVLSVFFLISSAR